jgi:hypothetical protein
MLYVAITPEHEYQPETWDNPIEIAETDVQDDGYLPALPRRFHITDPQQWIDLCA